MKEYNYTYESGRITRSAEYDITLDEILNVISKNVVAAIDYVYNEKNTREPSLCVLVFGQNSTIPNLMSYCYNEPVNKLDSNGQLATNIISGIVGALINVILDFITSALIYWVTHKFTFNKFKYNLFSASTLLAAASGFASGLLISSKYKRWVCAVGSGLIGGFTNIIYCIIKRRKISIFDLLVDVCFGLLWGYLGGSGVGNSYWKKSLFCKGGYFVYKGYKYSVSTSLRLIKPVIKDFVKSFAKYIGTQMADWLQKFVRKKV